MKTCSRCSVEKPLEDFHRLTKAPDGRTAACKTCRNAYMGRRYAEHSERLNAASRERLYGVSTSAIEAIRSAQGDRCAICRAERSPIGRDLHLDHDHSSGRVRGLLCASCNLGLGHFRDNVESLQSAILYLGGAA